MTQSPNTMPRWIAFLRAINVGGHTVKMDRLRMLFEELGLSTVETFIASGNVIFQAPSGDERALELEIERHLQQSLGYEVATFIRSPSELAAAVTYQPFLPPDTHAPEPALSIAFLHAPPTAEAERKLMKLGSALDEFDVHAREIYWLCRTRASESPFSGAVLEKIIGMPATIRNVTTVRKLAAKYAAAL